MMHTVLNKLMLRQDLDGQDIHAIISSNTEEADAVQLGAILALLHAKGETVTEIAALVDVLKRHSIPVKSAPGLVDIVGTGGDHANTVNLSTGASILASACGLKIAKHGNRAVSSKCGSADVLEMLGVPMLEDPAAVEEMIEQVGYGFLFAPAFHPLLKQLAPIRRRLGIRTTLNLIGPLVNPADVDHYVLGVYRGDLMLMYAKLLAKLGVKKSLVVHGYGTDELTTLGPSKAFLVEKGEMTVMTITPSRYGMGPCTLDDLKGGDANENARILEAVFSGEQGPISDTINLNAGAALFIAGTVNSLGEGVDQAQQCQRTGKAMEHLKVIKAFAKKGAEHVVSR
jgi:anthranilate phosphoribosyltransferase